MLTHINSTRILRFSIDGEDAGVEEAQSLGSFDLKQPTLAACSYEGNVFQVTANGVHGPSNSWQPEDEKEKATLAATCDEHILLALGARLVLLRIREGGSLAQVAQRDLDNEIACLDVAKLVDANGNEHFLAAAGLWNSYMVTTFALPDLGELQSVKLETQYLLRSVMLADLSGATETSVPYLLVGLGDGSVISYALGASTDSSYQLELGSKKTVALGSRPITMSRIRTAGSVESGIPAAQAIFILSDRSTIVSLENGKLAFASINLKDITAVAALHNAAYENALVLASPEGLKIGRVDELQKLQVNTLRLGEEAPRRIVHSKRLRAYGVVFLKETVDRRTGEVARTSSFKVLDDATFDGDLAPSRMLHELMISN